jgi:hypothetical protein
VTVERPLRLKGIDPERAYTPKEVKALKETAERADDAPPVIKKIHKKGAAADPLRGLFEATFAGKPAVLEYEPDPDLRDTEQVPLLVEGGIEAFVRREVLPHAPDAWYVPDSVKTGYLFVGDCVPFYFCPRSVMLYLIYQGNHSELAYRGGQGPIVHFEADLHTLVALADAQPRRWAFTLSNAGARYFEDRSDLGRLGEIDWNAVQARDWRQCKDGKQAEFLLEQSFPWHLVERIGVQSRATYTLAVNALPAHGHRPPVEIRPEWYY